jgi:hypothetical protein
LAPGGKILLVQEATYGSVEGSSATKGRLALLDVATGTVRRGWAEPNIIGGFVLTITPRGQMVYFRGDTTRLMPLGLNFPSERVITLGYSPGPAFFYADR